jgi:hypothetical protein
MTFARPSALALLAAASLSGCVYEEYDAGYAPPPRVYAGGYVSQNVYVDRPGYYAPRPNYYRNRSVYYNDAPPRYYGGSYAPYRGPVNSGYYFGSQNRYDRDWDRDDDHKKKHHDEKKKGEKNGDEVRPVRSPQMQYVLPSRPPGGLKEHEKDKKKKKKKDDD